MENVSLQFQRGIIMEKQNWKFYWKWSVFVLMTMICLLSFYKSYQNVKYELQEESQTLFQRAVQDDTNRRIKDLGDAFCFSYSGANRLERDSITIKTADAIIHMRNNKEVARRMYQAFGMVKWYDREKRALWERTAHGYMGLGFDW